MGVPGILVSSSPSGRSLWRLDGDGSVHQSSDGENWREAGRASRVEAFTATDDAAYVVTGTSVERIATKT